MLRIALTVAAIAVTLHTGPTARAEDAPLDRAAVETIVREYLLANPELLEEVFTALQEKREAEADAARLEQLAVYRDALENSPLDPVLGNPDGDVTMVEFFDYNCGYCKRAMDDMDRLIESDPNLRIVLKEFPVLGRPSMEAAAVSIAVHQVAPESYGEFHRRLLSVEQADRQTALAVAEELGLPMDEIEAGMDSDVVRETVQQSYEIAQALGLSGTPSYVIGDIVEFGAVGYDQLRQGVELTRCGEIAC